jgi:aerobic-type carbon monoxide dehydrogenase small subunit (CoxS/CutS family)
MILDGNDNQCEVSNDLDELPVWLIHEKLGLTKTKSGCLLAYAAPASFWLTIR